MSKDGKVRVYELARELGMDDSKPLMKILRDMGYEVKTASNSLPEEAVRKIREVVAPHIEQAKREAEVAQAKEQAEKAKKALKAKVPERAIRIVSRATAAEKEAILDRHRRKMLGEVPTETALEAKQSISEPAPAPPTELVETEPSEAPEVDAPEVETEPPQVLPPPVSPEEESSPETTTPTVDADDDSNRARVLPPDQLIAAEYREKTMPTSTASGPVATVTVAPPPPQAERVAESRFPGRGPKTTTREISPSRPRSKPVRPVTGGPAGRGRGKSDRKRRSGPKGPQAPRVEQSRDIELPEVISVSDLASRLGVPASDVIKTLIREGQMVTINQALDYEKAAKISRAYGFEVSESADELPDLDLIEEEDEQELEVRPPVVTVLGHVDHGKTSLLDSIREANVTATEAGGITQRIGAYTVTYKDRAITFIDTPGHEAFTQMRARGAQVTDIAILVVAADDGVMPQTVEAINHAKAAGVPIIVAVNKIDKPGANPEKVLQQLTEYGLVAEDWGGDTICCQVSALKKMGIDDLLEMILLVTDMQELKANPTRPASGTIIEAGLDKGLGPVATVLVQSGTLRVGDTVVVGNTWGRIRILHNENGKKIRMAKPSFPAEIIGLSDIPEAGNHLQVVDDEKMAKQVAEARADKSRQVRIKGSGRTSLEDFFSGATGEQAQELRLVVKADGQGSLEAVSAALDKLSTGEVKVNIAHSAVGAIRESDIMLASASNAIIIGFNVRPDPAVKRLADQEQVEIRLYRVIYHMLEEVRKAMAGLLAPDISEVQLGRIEVRQVIKITKVGKIAGCYVLEGKVTRDAEVRLVRDGVVIYEGKLESLKRFKDDVREVTEGYECGLSIANYQDIQEGDIIEAFRKEITIREDI